MAKIIRSAPVSHITRIVSSNGKSRVLTEMAAAELRSHHIPLAAVKNSVEIAEKKAIAIETSQLSPVAGENSESKKNTELMQRQALDAAVRQGYAEGQQKAQQQVNEKLQQLAQLMKNMSQQQQDLAQSHEDHLVDIIFAAICKIMGDHWIAQEGVLAVVKQVMTQINQQHGLKIYVAPADYIFLSEHQSRIIPPDCLSSVTLVQDEKIELGGCRVESMAGSLDGRLEYQMLQLKNLLLNTRTKIPSESP